MELSAAIRAPVQSPRHAIVGRANPKLASLILE